MVKVMVFYDSKYGNTRIAAEKIVEGLQSKGVETDLANVKDVKPGGAVCSDVIVLGWAHPIIWPAPREP
jgi:flavodoxin